jgi:hypothetical protein
MPRRSSKRLAKMLMTATAMLLAVTMTACGGGGASTSSSSASSTAGTQGGNSQATASLGPSSGEVVARVGTVPITKTQVSHWMATLAGVDYYELSGKQAVPEGLVSDPPHYGGCVTRLEAAAAASPRKIAEPSGVKLLTKCRQLYEALRTQATALLVSVEFVLGLAAEEGVTVNDAEVLAAYTQSNAKLFPTPAQLSSYRAARRASVSDDLLVAKQNLVSQKLVGKFKAPPGPALARLLKQAEATWKQKTDCRPGYVVEHCRQFQGAPPPSPASPPASVLMEQVAALATGRCTNLPACGKQ